MAQWAVIIPEARLRAERLFHHDTLELPPPPSPRPTAGDEVLVVATDEPAPRIVALGRVSLSGDHADADATRRPRALGGTGPDAAGGAGPDAAGEPGSVGAAGVGPVSAGGVGDGPVEDADAIDGGDAAPLAVAYTRRAFDAPAVAAELTLHGPVTAVDSQTFATLAARVAPTPDKRTWLVSLDLPIEAPTPAEAVRVFWSYVMELGPAELPAFVSPSGDELAMQAFVLGEEANQDPEEDD